jgi:hypothetical protein
VAIARPKPRLAPVTSAVELVRSEDVMSRPPFRLGDVDPRRI